MPLSIKATPPRILLTRQYLDEGARTALPFSEIKRRISSSLRATYKPEGKARYFLQNTLVAYLTQYNNYNAPLTVRARPHH